MTEKIPEVFNLDNLHFGCDLNAGELCMNLPVYRTNRLVPNIQDICSDSEASRTGGVYLRKLQASQAVATPHNITTRNSYRRVRSARIIVEQCQTILNVKPLELPNINTGTIIS